MYALKVLSGSNAGQTYPLEQDEMFIGRSSQCEITIPNKNISKKHAKIILDRNRILFTDLNSTNGSFVNGVKVEVTLIKKGDKISIYDTLLEVIEDKSTSLFKTDSLSTDLQDNQDIELNYGSPVEKALYKVDKYLDRVVMPPLHLISEKIDFKWIVGLLLFTCIVATALLSTIPLMSIIQNTVELESKRRASSLAKSLAINNRKSLQTGSFSGASVEFAYQEPGVKKAYLIRQSNGEIISPSIFSGQFPKNPKIHQARKITEKSFHVFKTKQNTIIAMHPIKFYSLKDGIELTKFYTVVIYDAKTLALTNEKTLSLFIQTLFLSILFGLIIFYFLYKIIEHPFISLIHDLQGALHKGVHEELNTSILLNPLKELYVISSSLLNRTANPGNSTPSTVIEADRSIEVQNLIDMLGYASVIISSEDQSILEYNPLFEELTNLYDIRGFRLIQLTDQALQQNLIDLVERSKISPDQIVTNSFEFSGIPYEIRMHSIYGTKGIAYFICSFFPLESE